jgi:TRAP-type mannitol/chloroaromatic compound transport system substrate-binding protein
MEYHADYAFHNVVSLQPLIAKHGLELRLFPDDVVEALGRTSQEVLAELGERTPLTRRIHASYMAFRAQANLYSQWFDLPMLRMRAAALGRV